MKKRILSIIFLLSLAGPGFAAPATPASGATPEPAIGLRPDAISAKTILEEMLSKRYSQGISTFIASQNFNVGVELVLEQVRTERAPDRNPAEAEEDENSLPADLLLGSINIDEAMKDDLNPELRERLDRFVSTYQIKNVVLSVGLNSALGDEVKKKTDDYVQARMKSEFGAMGKSSVSYLMDAPEKPKNDLVEQLSKFQNLVGQLVLAFAILLGLILWSSGTKKQKSDVNMVAEGMNAGGGSGESKKEGSTESKVDSVTRESEETRASSEVLDYSKRLVGLVPRLSKECDSVLRMWCQSGSEGILKLACFAEAVSGEMGKLPIPADSMKELVKAFGEMPAVGILEKRNAIVRAYWDLMMVINLGTDTLEKPFSYLSAMKTGMINQVLVDQNPKMKTLVALFMPDSVRSKYVSAQDTGTKIELLKQALDLNEIALDELRAQDDQLRSKLTGGESHGTAKDVVLIDSAVMKIVNALTPSEEMAMLSTLQGPTLFKFKRTQPSLAFIHEWPDDLLVRFLARAMPDEVVAYLRVFPDFQERVISLCPPMTAEVARDEIASPEKGSEADRNKVLLGLSNRLKKMVNGDEISLEGAFPGDEEKIAA